MANVANNCLVFHRGHVVVGNHALVASSGHKNVSLVSGVFHGHYFVAFHRGLQRVDRVYFRHPYLCRQCAQCLGRALAHVAVASDHGYFAGNHHVGRALDSVNQALAAAVQVVKLRLGHRVVHVDSTHSQSAFSRHFVQTQHASGGFFGDANDVFQAAAVPGRVDAQLGFNGGKQAFFFFAARLGQYFNIFLGLGAQVHQQCCVATVVQNHVRAFSLAALVAELENAVGVVPVVGQRLAFVSKHGSALRN